MSLIYEVVSEERKKEAFEFVKCAALAWFSDRSFWNEACEYVQKRGFVPETYEYYEEVYKLCVVWDMDEQIFRDLEYTAEAMKKDGGAIAVPENLTVPYDGSQLRRRYWKKVTEI